MGAVLVTILVSYVTSLLIDYVKSSVGSFIAKVIDGKFGETTVGKMLNAVDFIARVFGFDSKSSQDDNSDDSSSSDTNPYVADWMKEEAAQKAADAFAGQAFIDAQAASYQFIYDMGEQSFSKIICLKQNINKKG